MPLPSSGTIKMSQVRDELKKTGPISLGNADVRKLGGKPSGTIKMSDLYGKSAVKYIGMLTVDSAFSSSITAPELLYGYVQSATGTLNSACPVGNLQPPFFLYDKKGLASQLGRIGVERTATGYSQWSYSGLYFNLFVEDPSQPNGLGVVDTNDLPQRLTITLNNEVTFYMDKIINNWLTGLYSIPGDNHGVDNWVKDGAILLGHLQKYYKKTIPISIDW